MTVHDLHDALNHLPSDLLTAADTVRTVPKAKVIPWKRIAAMAAVLALVAGTTLVFAREIYPHMDSAKLESVAEAPAAMAPPMENQITMEDAKPEAPADMAIPEAPAEEAGLPEPPSDAGAPEVPCEEAAGSVKGMEEELFVDHSHRFAEAEETVEDPVTGYCGNTQVVIDVAGERHTVSGRDAVAVTDILINLDYDPDQVCRCMTDITVDTETLTGIRINLTEGFARCERGQAALTEEQARTLREILDRLP